MERKDIRGVEVNESLGFDYGKVDEVQDSTVDNALFKLLDDELRGRKIQNTKTSVLKQNRDAKTTDTQLTGNRSETETVVCLSFRRPCSALIRRFWYFVSADTEC